MTFLLIKVMARQECQLRYQLERMTNACPHCYGTSTKRSVWWECNHGDCLRTPETGNKWPVRQTSGFWPPQLSLNHSLFQRESKENVRGRSFVKEKTPVFFNFKWLFWCHHKMTLLTFLVKNIRRKRKKQNMMDAYRPVRTHISQWFQHCKDIPWHFIRTWGYSLSPLSTLPRTFLTRAQVILCTCTKIATFSL